MTRRSTSTLALAALLLAACAHLPPPDPEAERQWAEAILKIIEAHRAEIEGCLRDADAAAPIQPEYHWYGDLVARSTPNPPPGLGDPQTESGAGPVFRNCLKARMEAWHLPPWKQGGFPGVGFGLKGQKAPPFDGPFNKLLFTSNFVDVYESVGVMEPPHKASGPDPLYSKEAIDHRVEGTMLVRCVIQVDGVVRDCVVQQGLPYMDAVVVEALEARRYRPARFNGEPVECHYTFTIRYQMP